MARLASDYARLADTLPDLLGAAELANLNADGSAQLHLQQILSDSCAIAGWTLIKADSPAAAWNAAQRAVQFAEQADDVLRSAAATPVAGHTAVHARQQRSPGNPAPRSPLSLQSAQVGVGGLGSLDADAAVDGLGAVRAGDDGA